jgi:hypothetical protein
MSSALGNEVINAVLRAVELRRKNHNLHFGTLRAKELRERVLGTPGAGPLALLEYGGIGFRANVRIEDDRPRDYLIPGDSLFFPAFLGVRIFQASCQL